jgi:DnaJ family protein C protein 3
MTRIADAARDARLKQGAANHALTTGDKELSAGNYKKALEHFDKAIELNPTDHAAFYKRSTAYQIAGKMTQCHADLSKAIELSPDYVQAIGKKAKLLVQDAEFEAARVLYERLLALRQGDQKAMQTLQDIEKGRQYLSFSRELFSQNRHEEAVGYLDPLLEIAPNCIDARLMRANGQHILGRPEGVLADTGKVLKMQVSPIPFDFRYGECALRRV